MLTQTVGATHIQSFYSSATVKNPSTQSTTNNTAASALAEQAYQWEIDAPSETERLLGKYVMDKVEQFITTDYMKVAADWSAEAYQKLNTTLEYMAKDTYDEPLTNAPNGKIGSADWRVFKDVLVDLDGSW